MKRFCLIMAVIVILIPTFAIGVSANMAAPDIHDVGSTITFEKNEAITVLSEVLDITVKGPCAEITAVYRMKNTSDDAASTPSMFLSPNIENNNVKVTANGKELAFTSESYYLEDYRLDIKKDGWKYAVLSSDTEVVDTQGCRTVDTVTFDLDFAPGEEYDVSVSYIYRLGGYPEYDFDVKYGYIEYYLTPAAMWKDFSCLTINLKLDEDMPIIAKSSLDFEKVGDREYRYVSDTLPDSDLTIKIDQTPFQNFISGFRSPYLIMNIMICLPFIFVMIVVAAIIIAILIIIKRKHKNGQAERRSQ